MDVARVIAAVRSRVGLSQEAFARYLGVSFVSVSRWERGVAHPSPAFIERLDLIESHVSRTGSLPPALGSPFGSRGIRLNSSPLIDLSEEPPVESPFTELPGPPILTRISNGPFFAKDGIAAVPRLLAAHREPALTAKRPPTQGMAAGKNTYTYDAHTYHTKVPPQGIAELLRHYLPAGGLVLDPFAGSGMTGVAARTLGIDAILNELSPAASFIANRFVSKVPPAKFEAAIRAVLEKTRPIRRRLYQTECRECGRETELLYVVWGFRVICSGCRNDFQIWDACRKYGRTVREHEILREFPCPCCGTLLKKSRLARTVSEPVQVGYKCCGSRQQEVVHPPSRADLERLVALESDPLLRPGYFPTDSIPDGVNLSQPKRHGLDRIDKFYTRRNLSALSHLWEVIHRLRDSDDAAHAAFVFTSLYQRVTKLSEFRFWGGSGNTARFNVPYISNEANVFITFERKARTILDHLESTARHYDGEALVVTGTATDLNHVSDNSIDLIFTDPPFGSNINYSEMNILWESWLGQRTNAGPEAIVSRAQGKGVPEYQTLMTQSFQECYRVLRPGHWMLVVFMNSSAKVWESIRRALAETGFSIEQVDVFDKQHATFKQLVSANTAGYDLVLHCRKQTRTRKRKSTRLSLDTFLSSVDLTSIRRDYLHVGRPSEVDVQRLYSQWAAHCLMQGEAPIDIASFHELVRRKLESREME